MRWAIGIVKWVGDLFVGGSLDKILSAVEKGIDDETKKEEVKADVTKTWINAQASVLVGRTWWFQLLFVIPAGVYWSAVLWVSAFPGLGWRVDNLPNFYQEVFLLIVSALFIVDGGKALIGRNKK